MPTLAKGIKDARARSGFAIVSDPHTGRILALANYPSFDPNLGSSIDITQTKNKALTDIFEPGSVMKPFTIAAALEFHKTTIDASYFCENGIFRAAGIKIRDDHPKGTLTTAETLIYSSNICTYKIAEAVGRERLHQTLKSFGFASGISMIGFPGEMIGRLSPWQGWRPIRFANVAFGQGLAVTGLELVQAYGALANGGNLMKPYYVERVESSDGLVLKSTTSQNIGRVISPETAKTLRKVLAAVVTEGTGKKAATKRYTTGGKTGTAQKVDPVLKRYSPDKRIASFIGFAPIADPHLVIYVMIDEPGEKPANGGIWAAPVFSRIAEESLAYLNVAPDIPEKQKTESQDITTAKKTGDDAKRKTLQ